MVAIQNPAFILINQGMLAVETFFVLTGILMYIGLKTESKRTPVSIPQFEVTEMGVYTSDPTFGCLEVGPSELRQQQSVRITSF